MKMGDIFRKALLAYRNNLKFFLPHLFEYLLDFIIIFIFLFAAVLGILVSMQELGKNLWQFLYSKSLPSLPLSLIAFIIFDVLLLLLLMLLFNACARAAVIGMARESFAQEKTSLSTGAASVRKFGLGILGFILLTVLIFASLFAASLSPLILIAFSGASKSAAFGLFLLPLFFVFIVAIIIYAAIFLAPQQMIVKELGVLAGMKESCGFARKNLGAVLIYAAGVIAIVLFVALLSLLVSMPLFLFKNSEFLRIAFQVFNSLFSLALGLIIAPYFEIVKTFMVMEELAAASSSAPLPALPTTAEVVVQPA